MGLAEVGTIAVILAMYALIFFAAYFVIKTAVKHGVREALGIEGSGLGREIRHAVTEALAEAHVAERHPEVAVAEQLLAGASEE
jgi:hypothetical protein